MAPKNPSTPHRTFLTRALYNWEELSQEEAEALRQALPSDQKLILIAYADLLQSGVYAESCLLVTEKEIVLLEELQTDTTEDSLQPEDKYEKGGKQEQFRLQLNELVSVNCKDFVGNGVLSGKKVDGTSCDLIRYSKTLSDAFAQVAEKINGFLNAEEEHLEEHQEEVAKSSGPQEEKSSYRCPQCGQPLQFPSDPCPNCTSKKQVFTRLLQLIAQHKLLFAIGTITSFLVVAINLSPAILVRVLIDHVLNKEALPQSERLARIYWLVGAFFGLITLRAIIQHIRIRTMGKLAGRVVRDLRRTIYQALQRLSLSYYEREHRGRIMSKVLTDTRNIQGFVVNGLQRILMQSLMVIAIPIIMLQQHWKLGLIALIPIPAAAYLGKRFSARFKSIFRTLKRRFATLSAAVSDTVTGIQVVKSFAQEPREKHYFDQKIDNVYDAQLMAAEERSKFNPLVMFVMTLGTIIVWLVGGRWVVLGVGGLSVGMLVQFISYMNQLYNPVQQLLQLTEVFQQSATSAERVFGIIDMPSEVGDKPDAVPLENVQGHLKFDNVSFRYESGERVLKDINLEIQPGEMLGLVGKTGSGKSTLAALVCRFYDPSRGSVLLDDMDLRDIQVRSLRQNLGMVLQHTYLFGGTIRDNIAYGKPESGPLEVIKAAKAANAHDFIMNLPDGYDTEVGESGTGLSGGEKQRIAIARAILKDPPILILDEATSSVDTATEQSIQEAMQRLVQGRTTIAIAHRLSTLRNANQLVVVDDGEIIEQGTHEELLQQGGEYANLYQIQANFAGSVNEAAT